MTNEREEIVLRPSPMFEIPRSKDISEPKPRYLATQSEY